MNKMENREDYPLANISIEDLANAGDAEFDRLRHNVIYTQELGRVFSALVEHLENSNRDTGSQLEHQYFSFDTLSQNQGDYTQ